MRPTSLFTTPSLASTSAKKGASPFVPFSIAPSVPPSVEPRGPSKVSLKKRNKISFPPSPVDKAGAELIVANNANCCAKTFNCFVQSLTLPQAAQLVYWCRQDIQNVDSKHAMIDKMREKVNYCSSRREYGVYLKMEYKVIPETKVGIEIRNAVCEKTFMKAWGINNYLMKKLRKECKVGIVKTVSRRMSDRYSAVHGDVFAIMKASGIKVDISPERLARSLIPNTDEGFHCYSWLENRFYLVGDSQPNSSEIHLDPMDKNELHKEYEHESLLYNYKPVELSEFLRIWRKSFPHVKIRKYKSCTGKCRVCAELSVKTCSYKTKKAMEYIKACRVIHRTDFMEDRLLYHKRMEQAILGPTEVLSIITDGMQQTHTELPYSANQRPHENKVKQHLQGITTHGKRTRMFRTIDHISLGANTTIHTLLCAIEEEYIANGSIQKTIFIQIDGGSENANYALLAWMEILIYLDIGIEEIWVIRMRVGHNHADQDAKFGRVWKSARKKYLLTPTHYEKLIEDVLKEYPGGAKLIDVFVVPDLVSVVDPFVDPDIEHAFRGIYTQHVFRFQKTAISSAYPLGSRLCYRASALDYFFEFVESEDSPIGIAPRKVHVQWYPDHEKEKLRILTAVPPNLHHHFRPREFVEGSTGHVLESIRRIKMCYSRNAFIERDWNLFIGRLPKAGESAAEFVKRTGPLHVPFHDFMLRRAGRLTHPMQVQGTGSCIGSSSDSRSNPMDKYYKICLEDVAAGKCVKWSGGEKPEPARVDVVTRRDATRPEQMPRRKVKARASKIDPQDVTEGTELYVPASTWEDHCEETWPYDYPLSASYVQGTYICYYQNNSYSILFRTLHVYKS